VFSTAMDNSGRKSAFSSFSKRKPPAAIGTMNCCHAPTARKQRHPWWGRANGCVGSGALLVLLPKCPMCIAAYLALWTGASEAMPVATGLRPMLEILFGISVLLLLVRCVAIHFNRLRNGSSLKNRERNAME
jgi:hypothetical protein